MVQTEAYTIKCLSFEFWSSFGKFSKLNIRLFIFPTFRDYDL